MKPLTISITAIDAVLPQTQCGDCTYTGCLPYAAAMLAEDAPLNLCLPGGVGVLKQLGDLFNQDIQHQIDEMQSKAKPKRVALIREAECIGCTKCIQACPVDAIFGAAKYMHTVITTECTGCNLCVDPCPMDCIDMVIAENQSYDGNHARTRFQKRNERLEKQNKVIRSKFNENTLVGQTDEEAKRLAKKATIAAAIARSQHKNTL